MSPLHATRLSVAAQPRIKEPLRAFMLGVSPSPFELTPEATFTVRIAAIGGVRHGVFREENLQCSVDVFGDAGSASARLEESDDVAFGVGNAGVGAHAGNRRPRSHDF